MSVELVNVAKMVDLHIEPRLTNRQGDLSMRLVATKQVNKKKQTQMYCRARTKKGESEGPRTHTVGTVGLVAAMVQLRIESRIETMGKLIFCAQLRT